MVGHPDRRIGSLESSRKFSVDSLSKHLAVFFPMDKVVFKALWKSKSPRQVNILTWIMNFGTLNCSSTLQRKLPSHYLSPYIFEGNCQSHYLSPYICPLCLADHEDSQHLFLECHYSKSCWWWLFSIFNILWVFGEVFRDNVVQLLVGPYLKPNSQLLWSNEVKVILPKIWFKRNQRDFQE